MKKVLLFLGLFLFFCGFCYSGEVNVTGNSSDHIGRDLGKRVDGTNKGKGFLGLLRRPDGRVSGEITIGVMHEGKHILIPLLVPTLNQQEIDYLLSSPLDSKLCQSEIGKKIKQKAIAHAKMRIRNGKSPFAQESDILAPPEKRFFSASESAIIENRERR